MTISNANQTLAAVNRWKYTATGGETTLSGLDDNGNTLSYQLGTEQLHLNGLLLVRGVDYVATTGSSITGLTALIATDVIDIVSTVSTVLSGTVSLSTVTAKGDLIAATGSGSVTRLAIGSNGQALVANSAQATGLNWATPTDTTKIPLSTVTAKGDLLAATGSNTITNLPIGANNTILTADSAQATGNKWTSTITSPTISAATLTGTLTANSSAGTNGQYLQTTGSGVQWASVSAGAYTQLATGSISGTNSFVISGISQSYKKLALQIQGFYDASATVPRYIFNNDNGSTYATTYSLGNTTAWNNGQGQAYIQGVIQGSASSNNNWVELLIENYSNTSSWKYGILKGVNSGGSVPGFGYFTYYGSTSAITQINIVNSAGNWNGGTYTLYGVN